MQMQIKNNASDLQDYLKGLESWEEDMKEKDAALSKHKSILKEVGWGGLFQVFWISTYDSNLVEKHFSFNSIVKMDLRSTDGLFSL